MKWDELDAFVPFGRMGDLHTEQLDIAQGRDWTVRLLLPGKYQSKTTPPGGDFVVRVSSESAKWTDKAFKHSDLFADLAAKRRVHHAWLAASLAPALVRVVAEGADTDEVAPESPAGMPGLTPDAYLVASQALALAESRRYARFESRGGGRYLPARFSLGIMFGNWEGGDATRVQKQGLPGLEELRNRHGQEPGFEEVLRRKLRQHGLPVQSPRTLPAAEPAPVRGPASSQSLTGRAQRQHSNRELAVAVRAIGLEPSGKTWEIAKRLREAGREVNAEAFRE